jgi:hypothetical protein
VIAPHSLPERLSLSTSPWDLDWLGRRQRAQEIADPLLACSALVVEGNNALGQATRLVKADARIKLTQMALTLAITRRGLVQLPA